MKRCCCNIFFSFFSPFHILAWPYLYNFLLSKFYHIIVVTIVSQFITHFLINTHQAIIFLITLSFSRSFKLAYYFSSCSLFYHKCSKSNNMKGSSLELAHKCTSKLSPITIQTKNKKNFSIHQIILYQHPLLSNLGYLWNLSSIISWGLFSYFKWKLLFPDPILTEIFNLPRWSILINVQLLNSMSSKKNIYPGFLKLVKSFLYGINKHCTCRVLK